MSKNIKSKSQLKSIFIEDPETFFEVIKESIPSNSKSRNELIHLEKQIKSFENSKRLGVLSPEIEFLRENQITQNGIKIIDNLDVGQLPEKILKNGSEEKLLEAKDKSYEKLQKKFEKFGNTMLNSSFGLYLSNVLERFGNATFELEYVINEILYKNIGHLFDIENLIKYNYNSIMKISEFTENGMLKYIKKYETLNKAAIGEESEKLTLFKKFNDFIIEFGKEEKKRRAKVFKKKRKHFDKPNSEGKYFDYLGVLIFFLKWKISHLEELEEFLNKELKD